MSACRLFRNRPCRICGKWFRPHPRLGDRQMTCGAEPCKRAWHAKQCSAWNRRHKAYHRSNYLSKKLAASEPPLPAGAGGQKSAAAPRAPAPGGLDGSLFEDLISPHLIVIIGYMINIGLRSKHAASRSKGSKSRKQCQNRAQTGPDRCSRSDTPLTPQFHM